MVEAENRILEETQYQDSELHEEAQVVRTLNYSKSDFMAVTIGMYWVRIDLQPSAFPI